MENEKELMRLSKLMSQRGICSRREADKFIEKGLVKVDGLVVDTLGMKVSSEVEIELLNEALKVQKDQVTIILNKPIGYVSSQPEDGYYPAIVLLTPENQDPQYKKGYGNRFRREKLAVTGRLDIDSQGLLLFTQDGRLAKKLIGSNSKIEKEYLVRVEGNLSKKGLSLLRHGLELDGKKLKPAKVEWVNKDQLRFVLKEGRKRQIRRMCELVGLKAVGLKRVRIGNITLGKLEKGMWRFLTAEEVQSI